MLISFMPQIAFAEESTERQSYKYNFGYGAFGASSVIPMSTTAAADTAAVGEEGYVANTLSLARFATDKTFATTNSAPWLAAGMHYVLDMKLKENELWAQAYNIRLTLTSYGFMLMIDVPEAGEYTPVLEYQALANSYVNNIILIPEDDSFITSKTATRPVGFWNLDKDPAVLEGTAGATAVFRDMGEATREKYTLGTLDMQEVTPDDKSEYKVFNNVTLEKKRYYLIFDSAETQTSASSDNKIELALRSFTLAVPGTVEVPSLKTVEASLSSDVIAPGSSATVALALKYEDGSEFSDPHTVAYESLDENVATVDANGVVTGVSDGKAKIKITVTPTVSGSPVTTEVEITVESEKEPQSLHYNFGYESYGLNSDIPISTNFAEDTAEVDGEGYVANTISIARFAKDKKLATVNSAPWFFAGMKYVTTSALKSGELWIQAWETRATVTTFGFMIAVDVPVAGEYIPALNYQALATGYVNNILLVPEDDARFIEKTSGGIGFWRLDNQVLEGQSGVSLYIRDLRDVDRENYQLGTVDMQEVTPDETTERKVFDKVTLEKKRYYLVFDCDGQNISSSASGSNKIELSINSFDLFLPGEVDIPVLGSADISFDNSEIYIGETANASLNLKFTDGQIYTEKYTAVYESLDANVATVDASTGVVTGVSEGKAKIKVTVTPEYGDAVVGEGEITIAKKVPLTAKIYKFGYGAYGAAEDIPIKTNFIQDTAEIDGEGYVADTLSLARFSKDDKFAENNTSPWLYKGMKYVLDSKLYADSLWIQSYRTRVTLTSHGSIMMIDVPQKGTYTPVLEYQALKNGYVNDILLIPADDARFTGKSFGFWRLDNQVLEGTGDVSILLSKITDADREKYRLGTVNMQEANPDETSEYKVFPETTLEKKKYYLIIDTVGQKIDSEKELAAGNKIELSLRSFRLEVPGTVDVPVLSSVELSFGKQSLPISRTTKAVLSMKYDDGDTFVEDCNLSFESLNDHATVDDEGNITAVNEGVAKIKVTVTPEYGEAVSAEAELPITSQPVLDSFRFTEAEINLLRDDAVRGKYETSIVAVMSDGEKESAEPFEVSYESSDESIATVDENGVITAVSEGKATVTVSAMSPEERLCTGTISVIVHAEMPGIYVDFSKTVCKPDKSLPDITPGYKILIDESQSGFSLGTAVDTGLGIFFANTYYSKCWPEAKVKNTTFAFSVNADIEGWYKTEIIGALHKQGGTYSIYTEDDYVGDRSFWNGVTGDEKWSTATSKERALNTVYLKRGENKIYMRMRKTGTGNPYVTINSLNFIPVESDVTLERIDTTLPDELAVGETFDGVAVAYMSDGTVRHFNDASNDGSEETVRVMGANTSNSGISADGFAYVIGDTGKKEYVLKGETAGTTTVTVYATLGDNNRAETTKDIVVTNDLLTSTSLTMAAEEIFAGDMTYLTAHPVIGGKRISYSSATTNEITSSDESVVKVEGNLLRAVSEGSATLTVKSTFNGKSVENSEFTVEVLPEGMTDIDITSGGSYVIRLTDNEEETIPMFVSAISNLGNALDMGNATVSVRALTPEIADIIDGERILPVAEGEAKFLVRIELDGRIREKECSLRVAFGKSKATIMTAEKAAAARENMSKYDWAKKEAEGYKRNADAVVDNVDVLYDMIHSEGIPRAANVGYGSDPAIYNCRYCNVDLRAEYSTYPWVHNAIIRPWKIQCPDCKRVFPSNDFGSFYKLGLNEYGEFSRDRALEEHAKLFGDPNAEVGSDAYYGYGKGYLENTLYKDIADEPRLNGGQGLRPGETVATWGVDDGFGYVPKMPDGTPYSYNNGKDIERHSYIAEYLHYGVWRNGAVGDAIEDSAYAYFYTGDKRYGRVAAILLDRLADFYPDYDIMPYFTMVGNSHGGAGQGKIIGSIWETGIITKYITAYDMVYDMYDDPYVLNYISNKNNVWKMRHSKENASQIRTNIEDGILRAAFEGIKTDAVSGNFGMEQKANAYAAVILDDSVESVEWIDFLMATGWDTDPKTGGGIFSQLVDEVDADGQGNEASSYNVYWLDNLRGVNEALEGSRFEDKSFNNNPKYMRMYYANLPLIAGTYSPQIGDTSSTAAADHWADIDEAKKGWQITGDPVFAQVMYFLNGNSAEGLRYGITDKNPERLEKEVEDIIREYGVLNLKSEAMTNFGYAILRDGGDFTDSTTPTATDTQRNAWMYFGSNGGHGHKDTLNLGLTAYGLNLLPDLGYPEQTGTQPNRLQWVSSTISHNSATVNGKEQTVEKEIRGKLLHFDGGETVQVMDVSTPYVYSDVSEYRRSVMTVYVDDSNSYTVDFFRILGGDEHLLSIHAQSNEISATEGLDFTLVEDENGNYISGSQLDENGNYKGTMAGRDATYVKDTVTGKVRLPNPDIPLGANEVELPVEYGQDPNSPAAWTYDTLFPRGYTWLKNVDRDVNPENDVEVEFKIRDFNGAITDGKDIYLRVMMPNGKNVASGGDMEISIADGLPPQVAANKKIDKLKYLLVKNTGKDLDTVFTTVYEPYRTNRYLSGTEELDVAIVDGTENASDAVRALKVSHVNGRCDYIFWATNNTVTYEIQDGDLKLSFRGFMGAYTINKNGENTYKYLLDGDILGESLGKAAITGEVVSFTQDLAFENEIVIKSNSEVSDGEVKALSGKLLVIDNGKLTRSGSYVIESAEKTGENITLNVGNTTTIRKLKNSMDFSQGYEYMIEVGQPAKISLVHCEDFAPVFDAVEDMTASAGSHVKLSVSAKSLLDGVSVTYKPTLLPRGANLDEETGVVTWNPTSGQIGDNHFAITAIDDAGRQSTIHFYVTVYGSTSGGGGGATSTTKPETPDKEDTNKPNVGEDIILPPAESDVRFTDLASHAWAADAINSLADKGIIKGTSETTYSPANNITRADFAILLVRAFEKESDNTENFSDVSESDYFAKELAVARNTGLVGGIGANLFAPRDNIKRCDMMLMVYRVLKDKFVGADIIRPEYEDFDSVPDYAKEAVSALIGAGLVNGKNNLIAPNDNTTRAEVAVLLQRVLEFVENRAE